ncbi:15371_t:CDS:2, partial [Acaulospora morrowiae]
MYFLNRLHLGFLVNKKLSAIYSLLSSLATMTVRTAVSPPLPSSNVHTSTKANLIKPKTYISESNNLNITYLQKLLSFPQTSPILSLPDEILTEICEKLPPEDLYALSTVCRSLRSFLWSSSSTVTQQIWRNSRKTFYPQYKSPPLKDMSEQQYIFLVVLAKKCQFCEEMDKKKLKKYWEFQVYSCEKCLDRRIASHKALLKNNMIHEDVLSTCLSLGDQGYFMSHVQMAQIDYLQCQDKFSWMSFMLNPYWHMRKSGFQIDEEREK